MNTRITLGAAVALSTACAGLAVAEAPTELPSDKPVTVNGYEVACTGIGDEAQADPRWKAFPVRIEFADARAEYLADVEATVIDAAGASLFSVRCDSPWLLVRLQPAKYKVQGRIGDTTRAAPFTAPAKGQIRVIVRFP